MLILAYAHTRTCSILAVAPDLDDFDVDPLEEMEVTAEESVAEEAALLVRGDPYSMAAQAFDALQAGEAIFRVAGAQKIPPGLVVLSHFSIGRAQGSRDHPRLKCLVCPRPQRTGPVQPHGNPDP